MTKRQRFLSHTARYSLGAVVLLLGSAFQGVDRVPGPAWERYASLQEAGWSPDKVELAKAFADSIGTAAFMLVHDGAVVTTYGDVERRYMCHSVRKSFLSALYGVHVGEGRVDIRATLADLGIDDRDSLTDIEKQATIQDLLKARSGVFHPAAYETQAMKRRRPARGSHRPNTFWYYNNWDFNTLVTIFEQETNTRIFEEFDRRIADPTGMQDYRVRDGYYHLEPDQSNHPAYPFRMSARDMARFGLLYLREGRWGTARLVPASWIEESTRSYSDAANGRGYGYMWWTLGALMPRWQAYTALGVGSQTITVIPELDLVFVHRVDTYRGDRVPLPAIVQLLMRLIDAKVAEPAPQPRLVPLAPVRPPARFVTLRGETLQRYGGTYTYPSGRRVEIGLEDGVLLYADPQGGTFGLLPLSETEFLVEDVRERAVFVAAAQADRLFLTPRILVREAYALLGTGATDAAVELLERHARHFPESYRVYDGLGRAYLLRGDRERAIESFRRSLELNPDNLNAVDALKRLGTGR